MTKTTDRERQEAIEKLREWIKPGDTVHTILRHVSKSGMTRDIGIVLIRDDGSTIHPNYAVSRALDMPLKHDAVRIGGCGMDMGFAIVYDLSYALYGEGYKCTGKDKRGESSCPSNFHSNGGAYHRARKHTDGYALHHKWL